MHVYKSILRRKKKSKQFGEYINLAMQDIPKDCGITMTFEYHYIGCRIGYKSKI